jgi:hypothetical protein
MRKFRYISLLIIVSVAVYSSCGESSGPSGLLTEEQMVPVLKDMQIAYAGVDNTVRNPGSRPSRYKEMNKLVLLKHDVDKELFYNSYEYYKRRPIMMDTIYQRVITQLSIDLVPLQNKRNLRRPGGVPEAN